MSNELIDGCDIFNAVNTQYIKRKTHRVIAHQLLENRLLNIPGFTRQVSSNIPRNITLRLMDDRTKLEYDVTINVDITPTGT